AVRARFTEKARLRRVVERALASQNLDRDLAANGILPGAIHGAHGSSAEPREDREAPVDVAADHGIALGFGHVARVHEDRSVGRALISGMISRILRRCAVLRKALVALRTNPSLR